MAAASVQSLTRTAGTNSRSVAWKARVGEAVGVGVGVAVAVGVAVGVGGCPMVKA